jgi:hypothetical protein
MYPEILAIEHFDVSPLGVLLSTGKSHMIPQPPSFVGMLLMQPSKQQFDGNKPHALKTAKIISTIQAGHIMQEFRGHTSVQYLLPF